MRETLNKKMTIINIEKALSYYNKIREDSKTKDKFCVFSISTQWNLKKNITIMKNAIADYLEFQKDKQKDLQEKYLFNDEKSIDVTIPQTIDGKEVEMPGRQVKDEYIEEFKKDTLLMQQELYSIGLEEKELTLNKIDLDKEIDTLESSTTLNMDDLDFLSIFC